MPNWCWNEMEIEGPSDKIKELLEQIKAGKEGDADADMAAASLKDSSEYSGNTFMFELDEDEEWNGVDGVYLRYNTRYAPLCNEVLESATAAYPELTIAFNFDCSEDQYMGYQEYKAGALVYEEIYVDDQYIDSREAVEEAQKIPLEEIIKVLRSFDPEADDAEYFCPTAYAILKARLNGVELDKKNFPQLFMKEV